MGRQLLAAPLVRAQHLRVLRELALPGPRVVELVLLLEPVDALVVLLGDLERAAGLGGAVVVEGAARVGGEAEERDLGGVRVRRVRVSRTLSLTKGTLALTPA